MFPRFIAFAERAADGEAGLTTGRDGRLKEGLGHFPTSCANAR